MPGNFAGSIGNRKAALQESLKREMKRVGRLRRTLEDALWPGVDQDSGWKTE